MIPKFRSWNGEQIISPDYITRDGRAHWTEDSIPTSSDIVMLSTGLFDKNGVEICESDIATIFGINAEVRYSDTWCGYVFFDKSRPVELQELPFYDGEKGNYAECEIIGNIYENPVTTL